MPDSSAPTIRAASLTGLGTLARRLGLDDAKLLRQCGLQPRQIADPEARVSLKAVCDLLDLCARKSGRAEFGLLMAAERKVSNLGSLGLLTVLQTDLRRALGVVIERRDALSSGLVLRLEENNGIAVVTFELHAPGVRSLRQGVEQVAGVLSQLARRFLGDDWTPRRVCFRHPPPGDLRTHRRMLGWAVEFEHDFNAMVFTSHELSVPAPWDDPLLAELAQKHVPPAVAARPVNDICREHLAHMLPLGKVGIDQVAQHMGLQRRTLQRKLDQEGMTFSTLLQNLRQELLAEQLNSTEDRLATVAARLGFSSPSAFSRWHKATYGQSARESQRSDQR